VSVASIAQCNIYVAFINNNVEIRMCLRDYNGSSTKLKLGGTLLR